MGLQKLGRSGSLRRKCGCPAKSSKNWTGSRGSWKLNRMVNPGSQKAEVTQQTVDLPKIRRWIATTTTKMTLQWVDCSRRMFRALYPSKKTWLASKDSSYKQKLIKLHPKIPQAIFASPIGRSNLIQKKLMTQRHKPKVSPQKNAPN